MPEMTSLQTRCCIVGGGPAGIVLGCLLARAGVSVIVLEKHQDFFRDFRGDTIHPSTLQNLYELGILDQFLKLPHQQYARLILDLNGKTVLGPDLSHLPTHCKFIALAPQWDFLNFMVNYGRQFPEFQLMLGTQATELIRSADGRVTGVVARRSPVGPATTSEMETSPDARNPREVGTPGGQTPESEIHISADLVIAADGRDSRMRQQSGLPLKELGVPIDVLWYRLPQVKRPAGEYALGHISNGQMLVTIDRGDYLQCATVIPKGEFSAIRSRGLASFQDQIVRTVPELKQSVNELQSWDQVKLLTVQMNRLEKWALPGFLCLGDAAHAMSPVGGVGVNMAIQDAVATANLLAKKLQQGPVTIQDLEQVQQRREWPAKMTQRLQAFVHRQLFDPQRGFGKTAIFSFPARCILWLFAPLLRRLIARIVGLGFRPERVQL